MVQGAQVSTVNKVNSQITKQSTAINYYTVNPLVFYGFTDNTGQYSLSNQTTVIPKLAAVGSSNQLLSETVYSDSSMRHKIGSYHQSWSLTHATKNTAWLCIDTSHNLLSDNTPMGASSECYQINAKGDVLASKVTLNTGNNDSDQAVMFTSQ